MCMVQYTVTCVVYVHELCSTPFNMSKRPLIFEAVRCRRFEVVCSDFLVEGPYWDLLQNGEH